MMKSLASYVELELYEEQTVSRFLWGNVLLKCRVEHESNNLLKLCCTCHAVISRDPDDPEKTRFALIGQADPGGIPQWVRIV